MTTQKGDQAMRKQVTITLRIDQEMARKLDAYAQALRAVSGIRITRSDVVRMLLTSGLERADVDLSDRLAALPTASLA